MSYLEIGLELIGKINQLGYEAYIVGGAVRDYLLGKVITDIDISTSMPISLIPKYFDITDTGSSYLSIVLNFKNHKFEVTNFRRDIKYTNHRHPEVLIVSTFKEDVIRRDFTINALGMDKDKKIYDYFNGINDVNNKLIKSINNPLVRFEEDSLRILRACYFASKLNFSIENDTLMAMVEKSNLLTFLSNERIYEYFIRLLSFESSKGIDYIKEFDLFKYIPKFKNWLSIIKPSYNKEDYGIYYILKYNELPPVYNKTDEKIALGIKELIDNRFSKYYLYKSVNSFNRYKEVLSNLGYDINKLENVLSSLVIKDDKELALSKEEIASMFDGKMKAIKIKEVITNILENKIKNTREDVLLFLKG